VQKPVVAVGNHVPGGFRAARALVVTIVAVPEARQHRGAAVLVGEARQAVGRIVGAAGRTRPIRESCHVGIGVVAHRLGAAVRVRHRRDPVPAVQGVRRQPPQSIRPAGLHPQALVAPLRLASQRRRHARQVPVRVIPVARDMAVRVHLGGRQPVVTAAG